MRDQAGNVVGTVVREVANSGDDEQTDEDAGIFEDIPLAVPVMDVVEPVVGLPSPLPSFPFTRLRRFQDEPEHDLYHVETKPSFFLQIFEDLNLENF